MTPHRFLRGPTLRSLLKSYLLVGLVLIAAAIALFTLRITTEIENHSQAVTQVLASYGAHNILSDTPDLQKLGLLAEAISQVGFPFVITDLEGRPRLWNAHQLGVDLPDSYEDLLRVDPSDPREPWAREVLAKVERFDRARPPLAVSAPGRAPIVGYLHYGESALSRRLFWMPWLEAVLIVAFMGVALLAFRSMKRSEQRSIWVGMAKETAHQLGTPLTSLNGWVTLLGEGSEGVDRAHVLAELRRDLDRLSKVSTRFSQIGSLPRLTPGRVDDLVRQVCAYFERRLPHLGKQVTILQRIEELPEAPINADLLDWALENLVKNALDALDKGKGIIELSCRYLSEEDFIEITVTDNGKGMSAAVQRRVFEPGFSTKQRGWGMGMVLVHRIVVEYHRGHVAVAQSVPGEGTTIRILLPTA